jgi:O-antigen/teichoic acid export membrane protein
MKQLAKEYKDFPLYSASQNVINSLSLGLPVLLLTHFYGLAVTGAYAFAVRITWAPVALVMGSLRQVLFQKASETHHRGGNLVTLYLKLTVGLFGLAIVPTLVLLIWAPQIFSWMFGTPWTASGEYSRSLVLWYLVVLCNLPAVLFARIIRIQRTLFVYNLVLLAMRTLTLVLGGMYLSASHAIFLFAMLSAVMNLSLNVLVGWALVKRERNNSGGEGTKGQAVESMA